MGLGLSLGRIGGSRYKRGFPYNLGFPYTLGDKLLADWDAYYGVTVTGSGVSSWVDRKSGYVLPQTTDAARPPYSATGFNGIPCFTYNGTSQFLRMASNPFPLANFEIWAVVANTELSGNAGNRFVVSFSGSNQLARQNSNAFNAVGGGAASTGGVLSSNSRHVGRAIIQTASITGEMDGSLGALTAATTTGTNLSMTIGGNTAGSGAFWLGSIHRILITSLLDAGETTAMRNLLLPLRML